MRIMSLVIALVAATAFAALGQEETIEDIKQGAKKAGEKIKEGAETVGEKTKEAAKTVAKETKKAWRETKAYASGDRTTYRKGARQKLNALSKEIADLKSQRSEATDAQTFDSQLDTLTQQQATAKEQLATMKKATIAKDYDDARKQFDKTIGEMEDGIAQARKQLRD
jgi:methyl-accepting chemotaxis protein